MADKFPAIRAPVGKPQSTLDDFYLALRQLSKSHHLPGLGFEFGSRISMSDYGIVGLAIASTRNLSEAISVQLRFLGVITNTSRVSYRFSRSEKWMTLVLRELDYSRRLDNFTVESELAAQIGIIKDLLPLAEISMCVVSLPHECPTTIKAYIQKSGCQVKFNQAVAMLQIPNSWGDIALDSRDESLAPILAERCQMILTQLTQGDDWVQRVQNYLLNSASPNKSLDETAEALGVSTPNLRWHLAKTKRSYRKILMDIRMKLACQYLEHTPLTLQQISYQLGYTYPSNFQLAFKKYFKRSPGEWRP